MDARKFIALVEKLAGDQYIDVEVHPGILRQERNEDLGKAFKSAVKALDVIEELK